MILQAAPSTGYAKFPPVDYGGVEEFIYQTSKRLVTYQDVGVLYGGAEIQEADIVEQEGFKIFRTPFTHFPESAPISPGNMPVSLANNIFAAVRLLNFSKQIDFELLHLHESHTQFLLAKHAKVQEVFTFHGSHTCIPYNKQTLHAKIFAWKFDGYAAKYCKHLVAISNLSKKNIVEYTGFHEDDVSVVHYGVDTEKFTHRKDAGSLRTKLDLDGRPVLICITRLARDKGIDLTVNALSQLTKEFPDIACLFCGISPTDLKNNAYGKQLLELISKNNLCKNVSFLGKISRQDLPKYLSIADVFVHPARVEAFGLAVGEAMASGLPPVCLEGSGGPDDMITSGKDGFLCKREAQVGIAEDIQFLLDNPKTLRSFGKRARHKITQHFSWERCVEKLNIIYRNLLH